MAYHPVARADADGQLAVFVCARLCDTCVFRPGNLMDLHPGRLRGMIDQALAAESVIPCHATIYGDAPAPAVCRGYFDRYGTRPWPLRWAQHLGRIRYLEPPAKEHQ